MLMLPRACVIVSAGEALKSCKKVLKAADEGQSQCPGRDEGVQWAQRTQLRLVVNRRLPRKERHGGMEGICVDVKLISSLGYLEKRK